MDFQNRPHSRSYLWPILKSIWTDQKFLTGVESICCWIFWNVINWGFSYQPINGSCTYYFFQSPPVRIFCTRVKSMCKRIFWKVIIGSSICEVVKRPPAHRIHTCRKNFCNIVFVSFLVTLQFGKQASFLIRNNWRCLRESLPKLNSVL